MKPIHLLALILGTSLAGWNCKTVKDVSLIYNTKVEPTRIEMRGKTILLTPIVHFGQKEFFASLKDSVVTWKGQGYTVFFEEINIGPHERNVPVAEYETILRKFRKMLGGSPTREHYGELNETFEDAITQPSYAEIGVDSTDFNADVTIKEFVEEYERLYGPQKLDDCDLETTLDSPYECDPLTNDLNPVIDDFRNKQLVKQLVAAKQEKIVVLYGAHHIKPLKKALKRYR